MRTLLSAVAVALFASSSVLAGRLDIAVLQFSDARDPDAVAAALQQVNLLEITNSDRTETNVPALRGGNVVFVQSLGVPGNGLFANSTRLSNQRADVSGSLKSGVLSVEITIEEGVDVGLRKFTRRSYSGSGSVANRGVQLLSVKQSKGRTQTAIKGQAKLTSYDFTTIVVGQYTP